MNKFKLLYMLNLIRETSYFEFFFLSVILNFILFHIKIYTNIVEDKDFFIILGSIIAMIIVGVIFVVLIFVFIEYILCQTLDKKHFFKEDVIDEMLVNINYYKPQDWKEFKKISKHVFRNDGFKSQIKKELKIKSENEYKKVCVLKEKKKILKKN